MRKINLKRITTCLTLVASFLLVGLVSFGRAQDDSAVIRSTPKTQQKRKACANQTLEDAYGFTGNGAFIAGNDDGVPAGPYTTVGLATFDGAGHFAVTYEIETFNGQFMNDPPFTGTYQVNPDCTFSLTNEFGAHLAGIILEGGNEIQFIATDPGVVLNFHAKKL